MSETVEVSKKAIARELLERGKKSGVLTFKEIMDAFRGEHFKAIFDFANFVQADQDTWEAYELLKGENNMYVKPVLKTYSTQALHFGSIPPILQRFFDCFYCPTPGLNPTFLPTYR